jgi:septal ring factor EnvC (AmiA/AmiB activator)
MMNNLVSASGFAVITGAVGYAFKRIFRNQDCIEQIVESFTKKLGEISEIQASLETDVQWVKETLKRIESRVDRLNSRR